MQVWCTFLWFVSMMLVGHLVRGACEDIVPNSDQDRPLPMLDDQFEATMIASYPYKNSSIEIREFYDYTNNRGAMHRLNAGESTTYLYDFASYETFEIKDDGKCSSKDMRKTPPAIFQYVTPNGTHSGHISPIANIMRFSKEYGVQYIGPDKIRELDVDHWASCIQEEGTNYTAHFYFSQPHVSTPGTRKRMVPVRLTTTNPSNRIDDTIYDFTVYIPGPISDASVFEVPRGAVCTRNNSLNREMPKLADSFTARVEYVNNYKKTVRNVFYALDFTKAVSRMDMQPYPSDVPYYDTFGRRPLSAIHDFNTGYEYVLDTQLGNCSVRPLAGNQTTWDEDHVEEESGHVDHVVMSHGYEVFHLADFTASYQGKRMWRGIEANVWSAIKQDFPRENVTCTMEVYFASENASTCDDGEDCDAKFLGSWMRSDDEEESYEVQMHVYEYTPISQFDPSLFDVTECFNYDHQLHLMLKLVGPYVTLVNDALHTLESAIWSQLVSTCQVTALRIAHVHLDTTTPEYTDVWFTLLDVPNMTYQDGTRVEGMIESITMEEAYNNLKAAIENTLTFTIPDKDETKVPVLKGSLMTDKEALDPRKDVTRHTVYKSGHSNGSMAALGIGMFFIGLIAGGVILLLWVRRNRNTHHRIPYTRDIDF